MLRNGRKRDYVDCSALDPKTGLAPDSRVRPTGIGLFHLSRNAYSLAFATTLVYPALQTALRKAAP